MDGEAAVSGEAGREGFSGAARRAGEEEGCAEGHQFLGPFWTPKERGLCTLGWPIEGLSQSPSSDTWKARACASGPTF